MSAFCLTQRDFFNTHSAYSDYCAVASPLQASQEITSASSGQPDSPNCCSSPTLMYSLGSITPVNAPSSSRVAFLWLRRVRTGGANHPLSSQASHSPHHFTFPNIPLPKAKYNKSYKHFNRLSTTCHTAIAILLTRGLGGTAGPPRQKGTINGDVNPGAQVTEEDYTR
ncbi:hypothetical protein BJV77DRAFT_286137 [Russula vinacea]|nr:hypothetical protein BJV77DRAFT_286137 [Russula vinacea]